MSDVDLKYMDSYSWIQKKFHKLVLSNQLVSEASHDIETYFNNRVSYKDNHVFVFGLARSGSTILLNENPQIWRFCLIML